MSHSGFFFNMKEIHIDVRKRALRKREREAAAAKSQ